MTQMVERVFVFFFLVGWFVLNISVCVSCTQGK